jgi:hypothetical protein
MFSLLIKPKARHGHGKERRDMVYEFLNSPLPGDYWPGSRPDHSIPGEGVTNISSIGD